MAGSSSTKRAAKLAQRSGRTKMRFQGGTLFPAVVAAVLVLGLATIVYARQSRPEADASPPTTDDHWHAAYGFYLCDPETGEPSWYQLSGAKEETNSQGQLVSSEYLSTGVHSHDDGVIHWHPFSANATGNNAQLDVFLDVYGVELTSSTLDFPDGQPIPLDGGGAPFDGQRFEEGETKCGDEDANLRVQVWQSYTDTGEGTTYTTGFDDIRVSKNSMVFAIGFVPDDVVIPMPPQSQQLPELGAADGGSTEIPTPSTTPGTGASTPGSATGASTAGSGATTPASTPASGGPTTPASVPATTRPNATTPASG